MLTIDMSLYPRKHVDTRLVKEYARKMQAGKEFPPIKFARVHGRAVVIDGVHRTKARIKIKKSSISADDLGEMSEMEAFAAAVRYNTEHGKALTRDERLAAYRKLIDQGYGMEKAADVASFSGEAVQKCTPNTATDTRNGRQVTAIAKWRQVLPLVTKLKTQLTPDIDHEETIQHLRGLRNLINERYSRETIAAMTNLRDQIDKLLPTLSAEAA
jgi:hypothetical protein